MMGFETGVPPEKILETTTSQGVHFFTPFNYKIEGVAVDLIRLTNRSSYTHTEGDFDKVIIETSYLREVDSDGNFKKTLQQTDTFLRVLDRIPADEEPTLQRLCQFHEWGWYDDISGWATDFEREDLSKFTKGCRYEYGPIFPIKYFFGSGDETYFSDVCEHLGGEVFFINGPNINHSGSEELHATAIVIPSYIDYRCAIP